MLVTRDLNSSLITIHQQHPYTWQLVVAQGLLFPSRFAGQQRFCMAIYSGCSKCRPFQTGHSAHQQRNKEHVVTGLLL